MMAHRSAGAFGFDTAPRAPIDFGAVNAAALRDVWGVLNRLLPGGRRQGAEYVVRNPRRDDRSAGSFSINTMTGRWSDFATGDKGGDLVSLVAYLHGLSQRDAAIELGRMLGLQDFSAMDFQNNGRHSAENENVRHEDKSHTEEVWRPIRPGPDDVGKLTGELVNRCAPAGFSYAHHWKYLSAEGKLLGFVVVRYDKPANGEAAEKEIRPFTFCEGPGGRREWRCQGLPEPRPLYGLDRLAARPDASAIVVEGEKAAEAAAERFPDYVVTTSPGGAKAAGKADWSPLAKRRVIVWPDHDDGGRDYATDVAGLARLAGATSARIVTVPETFPPKWDLGDELPPGVTDADLLRLLEGAEEAKTADNEGGNAGGSNHDWTSPDLSFLGTGRRPASAFPADLLGPFWADWCERTARAASAPVDYVAASLLAVAAAAIANVRWPLAGAAWSEPPLLWCALVGSPSVRQVSGNGADIRSRATRRREHGVRLRR